MSPSFVLEQASPVRLSDWSVVKAKSFVSQSRRKHGQQPLVSALPWAAQGTKAGLCTEHNQLQIDKNQVFINSCVFELPK